MPKPDIKKETKSGEEGNWETKEEFEKRTSTEKRMTEAERDASVSYYKSLRKQKLTSCNTNTTKQSG